MKNLPLQSANFKRDYVATLAIVLFFMIVLSEVTLAVAIPTYLHRENSMALEVRRLKLIQDFDLARIRCNKLIKVKTVAAAMELQLVSWNLDRLAPYLRNEAKHLDSDDLARIQKAVDQSHRVLDTLAAGKSFSKEAELKTDIYVDSLIPKDGDR